MNQKQAKQITNDLGWTISDLANDGSRFFVIKYNEIYIAKVFIKGFPCSRIIENEIWFKDSSRRHDLTRDKKSESYMSLYAEVKKLKAAIEQPKSNTGRRTTKVIRSMRPKRIERLKSESRLYNDVENFYCTNNQGVADYILRRNFIKRMHTVKWKLFGK